MTTKIKCYRWLGICLLSILMGAAAGYARQALPATEDSLKAASMKMLRSVVASEAGKSAENYKEHRISNNRDFLLEEIMKNIYKTRQYLKAGIDTNSIINELKDIRDKYEIAVDGIFTYTGTLQTERNLTTSYKLLHELLNRANARKVQVDTYKRKLLYFRNDFDSLTSSPNLYVVSGDSLEFMGHLQKLVIAGREAHPVDSALTLAVRNVQQTKDKIDLVVYMLQSGLEQLDHYEKDLSDKLFQREITSLNEPPANDRPFSDIISRSIEKGGLSLVFYTRNNIGKLAILFLLIAFAVLFLRTLRQKVIANGLLRSDHSGQLVIRYPFLSAVIIVLCIFQFIFPDPPFIFSCILWMISSICLSFIFLRVITRYWMVFWLAMWMLFVLACADNLILQASGTERWMILGVAVGGLLISAFALSRGRRKQLVEKAILYFIAFLVVLELGSIFANFYGRFNLSKSLMTSGFFSVIIAIMFLWTVRLINEGLTLAGKIFQTPERKLFFINFDVVGKKAPTFFYVFLVIGWFILFARNFYAFRLITQPLEGFLYDQRKIGDYSFSFFSVLAFFAILLLSSVISKIVSFFAADTPRTHAENSVVQKPGIGSWILLVRISIFVLGLLLAFAVAGIPLDRATFVLGALGVGIGFGLQSLVSNLVSGVILAFEKPLNVGDLVEVKGKAGTVESIGFRSSVLRMLEGPHLVIPNGELLNDQLVNWSMNKSIRRNEILVGVAYDTDLEAAKKILMDIVASNRHILKNPEPAVFAHDFKDSSIELQIYFWTQGLKLAKEVKSELIFAIQQSFRENHIAIPFPQRDVYIRKEDNDGERDEA